MVNQVIGEYMIKFVDKELRQVEKEISATLEVSPSRAVRLKEKLVEYQSLVSKITSGRAEGIQERIAFAIEDLSAGQA